MYILHIILCSGSCRTDDSTHIGYNDGYFKNKFFYQRICGNGNYTHTTSGKRVYITFHTDEQPNNFKKKGFSRIEYVAQGLFMIVIIIMFKRNVLFQILMNVHTDIFATIIVLI